MKSTTVFLRGVSLLEGYELKLNIDEAVRPVAQPICRTPFGLRQKLDDKLDELLKEGFIEEVPEGSTGSISPLLVVPKSDVNIRM